MCDKENFLKIVFLLFEYGSKTLQKRMEHDIRIKFWLSFSAFLEKKKHEIYQMTHKSPIKCCHPKHDQTQSDRKKVRYTLLPKQLDTMFDKKTKCDEISCCCHLVVKHSDILKNCDISLLSNLLMNFVLDSPAEVQTVKNLRDIRNDEVFHQGNTSMSNDQFNHLWLKTANAIKEIAEKCDDFIRDWIRRKVDALGNNALDKQTERLALEHLRNCHGNNYTQEPLRDFEAENLVDTTKEHMRRHQENFYVSPKKVKEAATKRLNKTYFVLLIGAAGSGKSRLGLELMSNITKVMPQCFPIILSDSSQWLKFLNPQKSYVAFLDDFIGKSNVVERKLEDWCGIFDSISAKLSKQNETPIYVIIALRSNIWEAVKHILTDYSLFLEFKYSSNPIDVSELGYSEKIEILHRYCGVHNIKICESIYKENQSFGKSNTSCSLSFCKETLHNIASCETLLGFPQLCDNFFSDRNMLTKRLKFFTDANKFLVDDINSLITDEKNIGLQYVILIYIVLEIGQYPQITAKELQSVSNSLDLKIKIIPATISKALKSMKPKFLNEFQERYEIKHAVIFEAVLISCAENFPEVLLKFANAFIIMTYVRSSEYKSKAGEVCVCLNSDMTEELAKKLIQMHEASNSRKKCIGLIVEHPSSDDEGLVHCLLNILSHDEDFLCQLESFVAQACTFKRDFLASKIISGNSERIQVLKQEIMQLVLQNNLIKSLKIITASTHPQFDNLIQSRRYENLSLAVQNGSKDCFAFLLDRENSLSCSDIEPDCEPDELQPKDKANIKPILSVQNLQEMLKLCISHHNFDLGSDWEVIIEQILSLNIVENSLEEICKRMLRVAIDMNKETLASRCFLSKVKKFSVDESYRLIKLCVEKNLNDFLGELLSRKNLHVSVAVKIRDNACRNLAMYSAEYGSEIMTENLVNIGTNPYDEDSEGNNLLHYCVFSSRISLIDIILKNPNNHALLCIKNAQGQTPLDCALEMDDDDIIAQLKRYMCETSNP